LVGGRACTQGDLTSGHVACRLWGARIGYLDATITQHTFADTFYSGQRVPFPTDNLSRKVLPTV